MKKEESKTIDEILTQFEYQEYLSRGYKRINGGFSTAKVICTDKNYIHIELKIGVQDEEENTVHTELFKLKREFVQDPQLSIREKAYLVEYE